MIIEFKPYLRDDGKFAYEIFKENKTLNRFVHWIDTGNKPATVCSVNRPDMVMSPVWTLEQAEAECAWLNNAYTEGKIK